MHKNTHIQMYKAKQVSTSVMLAAGGSAYYIYECLLCHIYQKKIFQLENLKKIEEKDVILKEFMMHIAF